MNHRAAIVLAATGLLVAGPAVWAHGPVKRVSEKTQVQARLFASDAATAQVVVIDLPEGDIVTRLATPPKLLTLGLTADNGHVFAMRGRDTERDTVSIIETGLGRDGQATFPAIVRTYLAKAPGGVRDGRLATVGGQDAVFEEDIAELKVFGSSDFASLNEIPVRTIKLAAPDHYHYQEAGDFLYVGHLAKSMIQILKRDTGEEVARIPKCPILHGMGRDDVTGRLFFSCMKDVVVVGTRGDEQNREVARITYPTPQRVAVFNRGKGRVLWGSGEGVLPALYRLDTASEPYRLEPVPVESAIAKGTSDDGKYLLVFSRNGTLDIRDGGTGKVLHQVTISKAFAKDYHEHVDNAILPDIQTVGNHVYVTVPPEGTVVDVDLAAGKVLRKIDIGGEPARLLAVLPPTPAQNQANAR